MNPSRMPRKTSQKECSSFFFVSITFFCMWSSTYERYSHMKFHVAVLWMYNVAFVFSLLVLSTRSNLTCVFAYSIIFIVCFLFIVCLYYT